MRPSVMACQQGGARQRKPTRKRPLPFDNIIDRIKRRPQENMAINGCTTGRHGYRYDPLSGKHPLDILCTLNERSDP
ncbi:hypothetical protein [Methanogenium organophilum]|uniref:Uncharacterized protein n=1 Tax=Methanogenium organophilum TaxID=2199 RepID=A0A9X9T8M4_METOG|nr:hypothetical protein [Methanogenium organophilum]WAI02319.1 hypothetical protein OU421_05455 [Methanogenium organophilum]